MHREGLVAALLQAACGAGIQVHQLAQQSVEHALGVVDKIAHGVGGMHFLPYVHDGGFAGSLADRSMETFGAIQDSTVIPKHTITSWSSKQVPSIIIPQRAYSPSGRSSSLFSRCRLASMNAY